MPEVDPSLAHSEILCCRGSKLAARGLRTARSALHHVAFLLQQLADAHALVALDLDRVVGDRTAGTAGALQITGELLEERGVLGQIVNDGHALPAAALLLQPHLGDDARGHGLFPAVTMAALAVVLRPAARLTPASGARRVHQSRIGHFAAVTSSYAGPSG